MARPNVSLDIHSKGDEQAAKLVYLLAKHGEDPRPAFRQILNELRVAETAWFTSHGEGSWPALAEVTRAEKARYGWPSTPLVRTGDLLASLTVKRGRKSTRSATKTRMRYGTKVWYARFHYHLSHSTPQRIPLIPVDTRTRRRMVHDVRDYLLGRTKGASE